MSMRLAYGLKIAFSFAKTSSKSRFFAILVSEPARGRHRVCIVNSEEHTGEAGYGSYRQINFFQTGRRQHERQTDCRAHQNHSTDRAHAEYQQISSAEQARAAA